MKIISILLLLVSLIPAKDYIDMYANDASDQSKKKIISVKLTVCGVSFGTHHGLYIKTYQRNEKYRTCEELAPLFGHVTISPYSTNKKKSGNDGSIGFGKKPHQCHVELDNVNGKLTGIPYGDKAVCSGINPKKSILQSKPLQ